ncbi:MAG TPA: 50S ribosomal protein L25/general stress protein Ctc [Solimonas sp.]
MKENFVVVAEPRADQGKGASRRLRRTGKVPAIVYGGKEGPVSISVSGNELFKQLKIEAFYSRLLTLQIGAASTEQIVLKDLQRHPVSGYAIHADFQRVLADQLLHMHVPLHFKGGDVAPGVKTGNGIVEHHLNQVEVECLPKDLPEFIEVDLSALEVNESVHLSQLGLPAGVALVQLKHENDQSVASVHLPRGAIEEESVQAEEAAAAAAASAAAAAPAAADAKKDEKKK